MENINLMKALLKAQVEIKHAQKDAKNPYFKSDYATLNSVLEACKAILNKNGILISQSCQGNKLTTSLIHAETGESISSSLDLINVKDMQAMGSAITYARRYTLQALVCIGAEDDDGNAASHPQDIPSYDNIKTNYKPEIVTQVLENVKNVFNDNSNMPSVCNKCGATLKISKAGNPYCPGKYDGSCK